MAEREEAHIDDDVLQPVQEEDDGEKKEQMVVTGDHVLRAYIKKRPDRQPLVRDEEILRRAIHPVRLGAKRDQTGQKQGRQPKTGAG